MKINCTECVKNFESVVVKDESKKDLTFGAAMANMILGSNAQSGYNLPWENMKKFEVARKFYTDDVVEIDKDDFQKLRELCDKSTSPYTPMITGQIAEYLMKLLGSDESEKNAKTK